MPQSFQVQLFAHEGGIELISGTLGGSRYMQTLRLTLFQTALGPNIAPVVHRVFIKLINPRPKTHFNWKIKVCFWRDQMGIL